MASELEVTDEFELDEIDLFASLDVAPTRKPVLEMLLPRTFVINPQKMIPFPAARNVNMPFAIELSRGFSTIGYYPVHTLFVISLIDVIN